MAIVAASFAIAQTAQVQRPAADVTNLKEAIAQGVLISPRVNAGWFNFAALGEAERAAFARYLPSADVHAVLGREDRETPLVDFSDYGYDATRFSITQMLFDGFATRDDVARLGYEKLSQYYDFKRASEEVALEVAVAYLEAVKYQQLVKYAADNLEVHRQIHDQISERTGGGASAGVDLDQAVARVGLAETNLVTEIANLNDVTIRFERLVGVSPRGELEIPALPAGDIPDMRRNALDVAYQTSPVINSAIENLRASQEALNATNAPMMPRLDLRYRREIEHDTDGISGRFDEEAIELVLTYNLFRGGADSARKREFYNLYYAAIEERKQACLNVRQLISNDFNDMANLRQQVVLTDISMRAQDKTRLAYRDQFARGQRTLLDLLDSQNEFFDSQRAHISATTDLLASEASTLANMGMLLASLDVGGLNAEKIASMDLDLSREPMDENTHALCPPEPESMASVEDVLAALAAGNDRYETRADGSIALEVNVQFQFDSATIASMFDSELGIAAQALKDNPGVTATVEGHTDSMGSERYNQRLSERRAEAVRAVLVERDGVNPAQVSAQGLGESRPVADNADAAGRAQNRRVELILRNPG
ncbi:MAG: TolC family protein [Halioglobus sp.]|nr:TolC family protein [Halioglobus sp.]